MIFAVDLRHQARVCPRLAEDCDDQYLAERLRRMASDLLAKAEDMEELPSARLGTGVPVYNKPVNFRPVGIAPARSASGTGRRSSLGAFAYRAVFA